MTGEEVKALRKSLGWSQKRLAEELGVAQPTIFRIERGQGISGPMRKLLEQLRASTPAAAA
jgi:transcriptional regulator with XRE-family HTH domain